MVNVTIVAFDGFTDIDVFLAWDLFSRLQFKEKNFKVKLVGLVATHVSAGGIEIKMNGTVEDCCRADVVYIASGPGIRKLVEEQQFLKRLELDPEKQLLCSICSGALILGALGHLEGLHATTYPSSHNLLKSFGATVVTDKHLVVQGNIATAAGCLAAIDLVSWIITKIYGEKVKDEIISSVLPINMHSKTRCEFFLEQPWKHSPVSSLTAYGHEAK